MKKPVKERIAEFVSYHIHGDGECNGLVLSAYAKRHNLSIQKKLDLSFFYSVTYCVETSIVMLLKEAELFNDVDSWIARNKKRIILQSDRVYLWVESRINKAIKHYRDEYRERLMEIADKGVLDLNEFIPEVMEWSGFRRFGAFLLAETLEIVLGWEVLNASIEWKKGATATSGLMNVYGHDMAANLFDKTGKLSGLDDLLDKYLTQLIGQINGLGGQSSVSQIETSLCAYRKFYKGTRYNGFYLDRMLGEIYQLSRHYPDISMELLAIRSQLFDPMTLGEIGGWKGVRPELKKHYIQTGRIN